MTRQLVKKLMPILQAYAEGKIIQWRPSPTCVTSPKADIRNEIQEKLIVLPWFQEALRLPKHQFKSLVRKKIKKGRKDRHEYLANCFTLYYRLR